MVKLVSTLKSIILDKGFNITVLTIYHMFCIVHSNIFSAACDSRNRFINEIHMATAIKSVREVLAS